MAALLLFLLSSRFSLDHPGTRPLSAGPSLGPEHPGTRLATPRCGVWSLLVWIWSQLNIMIKDGSSLYYPRSSFSMQYTSLQSKPYSNSRYFSSAGPLYHRTIAIHWTIGGSFSLISVAGPVPAMESTRTESQEGEGVTRASRIWPTLQHTQMG